MRNLIVVGSGIAGLFTALSAHRRGVRDVLIVTKAALEESTTRYAQGGIAAAVGDGDSWELHEADTLGAGAELCGSASASTRRTGASRMRGKGPTVSLACSTPAAMRPASTSSWPWPGQFESSASRCATAHSSPS